MRCPFASMNRTLPSTSRTVRFKDVLTSRSFPVRRAGETTRSESFSTRSVTFSSMTSPVIIPVFTVMDEGVTG